MKNDKNIKYEESKDKLSIINECKYKSLFVSSRDAVMTLEPPSWKFTSGNPATIKMFKAKDEAEFLSYEPWKLSPLLQPDGCRSEEKAKEMIKIAIKNGSNIFEWVHKRLNGEEFPSEVFLSKIELNGNSFLHALVRDITERKELIKKAKEYTEELETKVTKRTKELSSKIKELESINKTMVGRELKMVELKKEIEKLKQNSNGNNKNGNGNHKI